MCYTDGHANSVVSCVRTVATQWSPQPSLLHVIDIPDSPTNSLTTHLPKPEIGLYGNSILAVSSTVFKNSATIVRLVSKLKKYYSQEVPHTSTIDITNKISNKVTHFHNLFNEIQMRISFPIYPPELIINGPHGVSYIIESLNNHSAGYIRNKFTTLITFCRLLKYDWIPNNKLHAVHCDVIQIHVKC